MSKIPISNMTLVKLFQKKAINKNLVAKLAYISSFLLLISINTGYSQQISYPKHQFGIAYSSFSGSGLSYLIELNKSHSFQFSLLPVYLSSNSTELDINGILGGEYQFTFDRKGDRRFYAFAGASIQHLESRITSTKKINDIMITETAITINRIYNIGLGVAMEYKLHPRFAISCGIGLLNQSSDKSNHSEFWDRNPGGESFLGIGGSLSLRYVF